jgi:hypothetical protein
MLPRFSNILNTYSELVYPAVQAVLVYQLLYNLIGHIGKLVKVVFISEDIILVG